MGHARPMRPGGTVRRCPCVPEGRRSSSAPTCSGDEFCHAYAASADEWLTDLFDRATEGDSRGLALIAVGGYGRSELCPFSDLDVVLLHKGRTEHLGPADRIWYPVWDEGITLDHSVRRPGDALEMAGEDLRVALGLLDARVVCGDPRVAEPVIEGARERWVKQKPPWLGRPGRSGGGTPSLERRRRLPAGAGPQGVPWRPEGHCRPHGHHVGRAGLADYVDTVAIDTAPESC